MTRMFCGVVVATALLLPHAGHGQEPDAAALSDPTQPDSVVAGCLDRWREAVGGAQALGKIRGVHLRSRRTESGSTGFAEEWSSRDRYRQLATTGSNRSEDVCNGKTCWVKDWNGKVLELQGRDLQDHFTVAGVKSLLYGGPTSEALTALRVEAAGDDSTGTHSLLSLRFPGGIPCTLFLDKATGLPAKFVRRPYDGDIVIECRDWRPQGAVRFPFRVVETADDGSRTETAVEAIDSNHSVSEARFRRPADGPKDYRFTTGTAATGIPFNFENDHIMLACRVNGCEPIWFMFDTGANSTIVNAPRLAAFGLQSFGSASVSGGGNSTDYSFTEVASLTLGGVELRHQKNGVIDLSGLEKIYGMPMGGILGYDFVSRFVVRVDYDARTLDLFEPARFEYRGRGEKVPLVFEGNHPHVQSAVTVPGAAPIAADFVIDSGAAETANLTSPFVKANRLLELARPTPASQPNTMAGSESQFFAQTSVRGKLGGIRLGSLALADIPVNLQLGTKGAYSRASFSGTIGQGILRRFTTIYDYSRRVLILEPNGEYGKPFAERRTFGVTFLSAGPSFTVFTVSGVRKDSPAETAGLRKGDVITALDGTPATRMRLVDLRQALAAEGSRHVLEVARGDSATVRIPIAVELISIEPH